MTGYLIDGKWISPSAIEAVEYFKLAGSQWVAVASLEEWNKQPENARAFMVRTASGKDILCERPAAISQVDIRGLMAEKAEPAAGAPAPGPAVPPEHKGITLP